MSQEIDRFPDRTSTLAQGLRRSLYAEETGAGLPSQAIQATISLSGERVVTYRAVPQSSSTTDGIWSEERPDHNRKLVLTVGSRPEEVPHADDTGSRYRYVL